MRLSIIIPAYNVEKYIGAALDSVFAQDIPPHEVIIVDDGSTDSTPDIISSYADKPEVKVITTENQGLGPARNVGLFHATGDYIYFFDSDDVLDNAFSTTIMSTLGEHQAPDLVLFSGKSFQDDPLSESRSRDLMRPFSAIGLSGDSAVAQLVKAGSPIPIAWLYVSKRVLWEENEFSFKPIIHEDDEIFLRVVLAANNIVILENVLIHQRIRSQSIMTSGKTAKNAEGLFVAASTLVELYESSCERPYETRRAIRKRAIRTIQRYMRVCRKVDARQNTAAILSNARKLHSIQLIALALVQAVTKSDFSR